MGARRRRETRAGRARLTDMDATESTPTRRPPILRWAVIALGLLAVLALGRFAGGYLEGFKDWVATSWLRTIA